MGKTSRHDRQLACSQNRTWQHECVAGGRTGLTLIETLVVIGLIGLLLALLLPAIGGARDSAARLSCSSKLRQICLATHHYEQDHGCLPPRPPRVLAGSPESLRGVSWLGLILPYIEQDGLWQVTQEAFRLDPVNLHNPPHVGLSTVIRLYVCPSDGRLDSPHGLGAGRAYSSYLGVSGTFTGQPDGVLTGGQVLVRLTDITDGTSNTLMVGERPPSNHFMSGAWYVGDYGMFQGSILPVEYVQNPRFHNCWPAPGMVSYQFGPGRIDNRCDEFHYWSLHRGGANFGFADGSVHFLPYSVRPLMQALASRSGGEVVEVDW